MVLACLDDDKATIDIMGRSIKYIDLLRDPEQFDLSFFNKWLAKLEWIDNVENLLELTEDRALQDSKNFYAEPKEHCIELVREILSLGIKNNPVVGDFCAGRGAYIVHFMIEAPKQGLDIDPKNVYYNDINPLWVEFFKKLNKDFKLGIPESNITCQDARTLEYDMIFDIGLLNSPYKEPNKSVKVRPGGGTGNVYTDIAKIVWEDYINPETGIMAIVTPTTMYGSTQMGQVSNDLQKIDGLPDSLVRIKTRVEEDFARDGNTVGTVISYGIAMKDISTNELLVNGNPFSETFDKIKFVPRYTDSIALNIFEKITTGTKKFSFKRDTVLPKPCTVIHQMQGAKVTGTGQVKHHNERYGETDAGLLYHSCINQIEFEKTLSTSPVKFFIRMVKQTNTVYPGMLNSMSMHPKEGMTNEELYKHFDFTSEEIEYIKEFE